MLTPKQRVIDQILHRETGFVPYRLAFETEQLANEMDVYYGNNVWRKKLDNAIVYLEQPHPGLAIPLSTPSYISLWVDCFGGQWDITKNPPHIVNPPLREPTLAGYRFPDLEQVISSNWVDSSLKSIQTQPDHFFVARLGFGIFERSWALRGFENSLMDAVANELFYEEMIEKITEFQMRLLEFILARLPVDGILFADDWCYQKGVLLGSGRWRKYLKPRVASLYKRVHQAGKIALNHVCGSVTEIIPDLIEIGLDVLESVQPEAKDMCPYDLKKKFGRDLTFFGGLGSQSVIPFGTPSEIRSEVARLAENMARGGGYILAPAKPIQPGTPPQNSAAVLEGFLYQAGVVL